MPHVVLAAGDADSGVHDCRGMHRAELIHHHRADVRAAAAKGAPGCRRVGRAPAEAPAEAPAPAPAPAPAVPRPAAFAEPAASLAVPSVPTCSRWGVRVGSVPAAFPRGPVHPGVRLDAAAVRALRVPGGWRRATSCGLSALPLCVTVRVL